MLYPAYLVFFIYVLFYTKSDLTMKEYVPKYKRSFATRTAARTLKIIETWLVPPWEQFCYKIQTLKKHRYKYQRKRHTKQASQDRSHSSTSHTGSRPS